LIGLAWEQKRLIEQEGEFNDDDFESDVESEPEVSRNYEPEYIPKGGIEAKGEITCALI
jgi:hypothetical protein